SSTSGSSAFTASPAFLSQFPTVASVTLSPSSGTRDSSVEAADLHSLAGTPVDRDRCAHGAAAGADLPSLHEAAAAALSPSEIAARSAPTATVAPCSPLISPRTPADGAGTSSVTLSVSSSTSGSSASTPSPGLLNHFPTVASV